MRVPLSWLRDFAAFPDDVGVVRAALDDLGLVVEAIEHVGEGLGDVVVARVLEISPIEGADKIRLVRVDAGGAEPVEIVCGAHNFTAGDRVPLAPVGAILPGGFEIARRKMRGIWSNGMLCSGEELGLSDDGAGLLVLGGDAPGDPGTPLLAALGLEADVVFDIAVEGNRPDALVRRRHRPRPGRALWVGVRGTRAPCAAGDRRAGREGGDGVGRERRPVPPPDRDGARRRRGRALAGLDRPPAAPGRDASYQQCGGRLELRDARARPAHAPLRHGQGARTRPHRAPGPSGRDGRDARRRHPHGGRARSQPGRHR